MVKLPDVLLAGQERAFTLDAILHQANDTELAQEMPQGYRKLMGFNLPPWQREIVWTTAQQQRFIESIFLGLGTGHYVATSVEFCEGSATMLNTSLLLLDGQQRLTSIQDFVKNVFPIFDDIHYGDLTKIQQRTRFRHTAFPCIEVSALAPESALKEMYYRLNHGGTAHTAADIETLRIESL